MKFNVRGTYRNNLLESALEQLCERYAEQAANGQRDKIAKAASAKRR